MSFSSSFSRLKRRVSRPSNPLRRVFRHLTPVVTKIAALALPLAGLASTAVAQTQTLHTAPKIEWWQAIILGLVQGLTEFIPVSSSAHLNITHHLMGHGRELAFDVFLHIGTLSALIYFFRKDWKALLFDPAQRKLRNLVFLACVPAALVALPIRPFEDQPPLSEVWFNAVMLVLAGGLMYFSDRTGCKTRTIESTGPKDALWVGAAQALALIPGVSRSGSTLTAGLFLGLQRADAMRFSFLLSLPITIGAILFEARGVMKEGPGAINADPISIILGILAAAAAGFWAIGFLLNYLKTKDVLPFFIWRVGVAILVFLVLSGR
ncbi:MAG TPA: undecaprenyl-diphosphate phosphatase [Abditibacterium sp.]|jgi:undecaprenyl-diphosphatase